MKIYISGPMTGLRDFNYPAFNRAEKLLLKMGHKVFNPANIKGGKDWGWKEYMRECIKAIPDCTHIYMMKGWEDSKGANVEYSIANILGMQVIHEGQLSQWKTK